MKNISKRRPQRPLTIMLVTMLIVATLSSGLIATGCNKNNPQPGGSGQAKPPANAVLAVDIYRAFADNPGYTYTGTPAVPAYTVEPGLSNIVNLKQYTTGYKGSDGYEGYWLASVLSDETKTMIGQNGFAVSNQTWWPEYFGVYESNRYGHVPSFITVDSAVHTFFLMFDYVLRDTEQTHLYYDLIDLSNEMVSASNSQYQALKGTDFENAALRNVAYFSVGASLLDPGFSVPEYAQDLVSQELALIKAHAGITTSPLMNAGEGLSGIDMYNADYTQYIPRGHYTLTPELTAYFKAMMWYGQMTFRSVNQDEAKSALLQTSALQDKDIESLWMNIFEPTNFFVGECDDITWYQYTQALGDVYGDKLADTKALTDGAAWDKAYAKIKSLPPPQINSIPIYEESKQPDRDSAITGFRFMGQRFTIDAAIMQRLMDRLTPGRMLPKALDIPAALGSDEALNIIKSEGDADSYPKYLPNMDKVRSDVAGVSDQTWHSNLYWSWLDMLKPLAGKTAGAGMPLFMQNEAWTCKDLNTFIGSWTELKYSTVLYAKQPMSEMGGGGDDTAPTPPDDRGYVEPNPNVYGRLAALVQMTLDGLEQRGLLTDPANESLTVLKTLADGLRTISEKELGNEALSSAEYDFIRTYGGELEHIWQTAKSDEFKDVSPSDYMYQHPGAVVVDVATDPKNGLALQEATGYGKEIYVAFPRDGQVVLGRGVVYSQYEFTMPIQQRMTVDAWHNQVLQGNTPPLAGWMKSFVADINSNNEP